MSFYCKWLFLLYPKPFCHGLLNHLTILQLADELCLQTRRSKMYGLFLWNSPSLSGPSIHANDTSQIVTVTPLCNALHTNSPVQTQISALQKVPEIMTINNQGIAERSSKAMTPKHTLKMIHWTTYLKKRSKPTMTESFWNHGTYLLKIFL